MKPFLKWAGNKYRLLEKIKKALPPGNRLIEPFVGSGALFLNSDYPRYLLADHNADLINTFHHLKTEGGSFIAYCNTFFSQDNNQADKFYDYRNLFNTTLDTRLKSALFIYLNKHCFNGLCRYNQKKLFNTPFGRYKKPYFPEKEMWFFHQRAAKATFQHNDFLSAMTKATPGDVVYCDPPYAPLTKTANFTHYYADAFTSTQQRQLAEKAKQLANQGIPVIISNHYTDFILEIYQHAEIQLLDVQRNISCHGAQRKKVKEVIAVFASN